jgi:hypothetical protein
MAHNATLEWDYGSYANSILPTAFLTLSWDPKTLVPRQQVGVSQTHWLAFLLFLGGKYDATSDIPGHGYHVLYL